ncbi:MAG: sulfatase-like hydrolase/transferase [Myxococcota bacterium]
MWFLLASCRFGPSPLDLPPADPPERPVPRTSGATALGRTALGRTAAGGAFTLPPSSRPGGAPAPATIPLASFALEDHRPKSDVYRAPMPVEPGVLPSAAPGTMHFGTKAPPGFVVTGPSGPVPFERNGRKPGTWGYDRDALYLGVTPGGRPPDARQYTVTFPAATAAEDAMNLATSGLAPEAFAARTFVVGSESYAGLFLPPPAEARFTVAVPERGALSFVARILAPAIASDAASDGATVVVSVDGTALGRFAVDPDGTTPVRVDLAAYAGKTVALSIATASDDPTLDYLLLEGPTVYPSREDPERIVLVFVDTLRADHLHFMGYPRETTPVLDRLAAHATVFEQARTVAPWTLPSARAALTGRQPEDWYDARTLPEVLGAAGWRTDAIVTNAFLSPPFDLHRGWDHYAFEHLLPAAEIVDRGLEVLDANPDRDQLLLVHFMEPHLPFDEPWSFRHVWAGARPDAIRSLTRDDLIRVAPGSPEFEEVKTYVTKRYDQEILLVDDRLEELLDAVGQRATVVLFADHGEELWDHGGYEHGHAFWDELLRVPLVIRSPYLPPGRIDAPVSLLDLAPTLEQLAGVPIPDGTVGTPLGPVAWGDPGAADALVARPLAFGRPLYGPDGWGVVDHGSKWWDRAGVQAMFSVNADPRETIDLAPGERDLDRWPDTLSDALGRPVHHAWRVEIRTQTWPADLEVTLSHPDGFAQVWAGYDPRGGTSSEPQLVNGIVTYTIRAGEAPPRALYLVPVGDPLAPNGLAASVVGRGVHFAKRCELDRLEETHDPHTLLTAGDYRFGLSVELAWVPEPSGTDVSAYRPEMEEQLRELGYLGPDE